MNVLDPLSKKMPSNRPMDSMKPNLPKPKTMIDAGRQSAIKGIMDQGIDDPSKILSLLNYNDKNQKIGDYTLEEIMSLINTTKASATKSSPLPYGGEAQLPNAI